METENFNAKSALRLTKIIYLAMLMGITIFLIVVLIMNSNLSVFELNLSDPLLTALLVMTITVLPIGYIISKKHFSKIDPNSSLGKKYELYQSGLLIRLATCEGISLFSITCLLITGNLISIVFLLISLSLFILYFPTPVKIATDIMLTESETEQFYN